MFQILKLSVCRGRGKKLRKNKIQQKVQEKGLFKPAQILKLSVNFSKRKKTH